MYAFCKNIKWLLILLIHSTSAYNKSAANWIILCTICPPQPISSIVALQNRCLKNTLYVPFLGSPPKVGSHYLHKRQLIDFLCCFLLKYRWWQSTRQFRQAKKRNQDFLCILNIVLRNIVLETEYDWKLPVIYRNSELNPNRI